MVLGCFWPIFGSIRGHLGIIRGSFWCVFGPFGLLETFFHQKKIVAASAYLFPSILFLNSLFLFDCFFRCLSFPCRFFFLPNGTCFESKVGHFHWLLALLGSSGTICVFNGWNPHRQKLVRKRHQDGPQPSKLFQNGPKITTQKIVSRTPKTFKIEPKLRNNDHEAPPPPSNAKNNVG